MREDTTSLPMLIPAEVNANLTAAIEERIPAGPSRESLLNYLRYGIPVGSFLCALLSNDLAGAVRRADAQNERALYHYVHVLYVHAPAEAWGSPLAVRGWIEAGMLLRRQQQEATR